MQQLHQIRHPFRRHDGEHDRRRHPHHPWRRFAGLSDWKLEWTNTLPPTHAGRTIHAEHRVIISEVLSQAERRCTIAHETEHVLRGSLPSASSSRDVLRLELAINRHVSRLLIPDINRIGTALTITGASHDATASELWVDSETLSSRLSAMTPIERALLDEHLAGVFVA